MFKDKIKLGELGVQNEHVYVHIDMIQDFKHTFHLLIDFYTHY